MTSRELYASILENVAQYLKTYDEKSYYSEDFIVIFKTRYSNNITIEDWNTLFQYVSNLNSDSNAQNDAIQDLYSKIYSTLEYVDTLNEQVLSKFEELGVTSIKRIPGSFSNYNSFATACANDFKIDSSNFLYSGVIGSEPVISVLHYVKNKDPSKDTYDMIGLGGSGNIYTTRTMFYFTNNSGYSSIIDNAGYSRGHIIGDVHLDKKLQTVLPYVSSERPKSGSEVKIWFQIPSKELVNVEALSNVPLIYREILSENTSNENIVHEILIEKSNIEMLEVNSTNHETLTNASNTKIKREVLETINNDAFIHRETLITEEK